MNNSAPYSKNVSLKRLFFRPWQSFVILLAFMFNSLGPIPVAQADEFRLPKPGVMVYLSSPINSPILKGIKIHPDDPFSFDFILDKGDNELSKDQLKGESSKLIKYFLASLTIPENDLWVNLSPYEKDRIIPNSFGLTEMGRDLLAEDYMLKQITASLIYPEDEIGKRFWKRIYEEVGKKYGTTNIPVNTFNKVWIVPEKAVVYENTKAGTAYVVESKLKVMLEQDYLSLEKHQGIQSQQVKAQDVNQLGSQIVREIVIPELTKEVNEGRNFARLRQVYNSLILAYWYKNKIKDSILTQVYASRNKVAGINIDDPKEKEHIYKRYLRAFKKGVYNYIKEEKDPITQEFIPRKYFSGGTSLDDKEMSEAEKISKVPPHESLLVLSRLEEVDAGFKIALFGLSDNAMTTEKTKAKISEALKTLNGITNSVQIAQVAGVHFNTVKRLLKELLPVENERRRLAGLPVLALHGDLNEMISDKLANFPGGRLTRFKLADLVGVTDDSLGRYDWRGLIEKENIKRASGGKPLIQFLEEAAENPELEIIKALREMDGVVTIETIAKKAHINSTSVGQLYRRLVDEENIRRTKEEPQRPLLDVKLSPMKDLRKIIQDALQRMEGEVSAANLQETAGLRSHVPLLDYDWRQMVKEENIRRIAEKPTRKSLTTKAPPVTQDELRVKVKQLLKSWPAGIFILKDLIEKADSQDTSLRNLGYRQLIDDENRDRLARGVGEEGLISFPKKRETDPIEDIKKALRSMEGRVGILAVHQATGLSGGLIQRNNYKNLVRDENIRRRKEEPARFLLIADASDELEAIKYALPKIEGKQTGKTLFEITGMSSTVLQRNGISLLIQKENERRQREEPGRSLIGYRSLADNPLEDIKGALKKLDGLVTSKSIATAADLAPGTVQNHNFRMLVAEENVRRQASEPTRGLLMLEEEHVARGEGRPRIIQVLRQMQGYVTAKMIAEAAEVSEGTVYLNRYRTLVVEENIRRVKEEPTRLLLELPQRGETDDELKVKAKFLDDLIEKYNLEDVISGTVEDVEVMMDILMLLDIKLPQSILEAITVHAYRGLKGQAVDRVSLMDFHGYQEIPETIKIRNYKKETDETSIIFEGQVPVGFSQVQIVGDRNKTVEVDGNGRFRTRIILAKGKEVKLTFFGFNEDNKQRTQIQNVTVKQTSQEITPEEVLADLMYQKEEVRKEIESKPVILKYVISRLELGLLQYFTEDEEEGMRQIALRIKRAQNSHNDLMEKIYVSIQDKFNQIKDLRIDDFREQDDLGRPQKMYFYQKYIFYEVEERIMQKLSGDNDSLPGVIVALEQGLGKTPLALALMRANHQGALVAVPSAVANTWGEAEAKFFKRQMTNIIAHGSHESRVKALSDSKLPINVVTFEFLRSDTFNRFKIMNRNPQQLLFLDESQMLGYEDSLQAQGADKLQSSFTVLLSGTPIVNVGSVRSVIRFLEKNNVGLKDARIFSDLFNKNDPESLRLLHFMIKKYTLRIKCRHVFKEYDPKIPLDEQKDRLPAKTDISPDQAGAFPLGKSQESSIEQLFTDWPGWVANQQKQGLLTEQDQDLQKAQQDDSYFSKLHALLQIMTFNDYSDRNNHEENPKVQALDKIVGHEVRELGGKVLISAKYNEEISRYAKRYRGMGYGVVTFYGETDKEFRTKAGYIADEQGKVQNFKKKNIHEFVIGSDGKPVPEYRIGELNDAESGPLTPRDYNRLVFQNDPNTRICITNDATGGVGVNFTAANATIRTNRGRDVVIEDQFDKRINRIDNSRKKYETRHYVLEARYSTQFLDRMKTIAEWSINNPEGSKKQIRFIPVSDITESMRQNPNNEFETLYDKYFSQGTYDQVQGNIFKSDRVVLDVILGGLQSQGNLDELDMERMLIKFPNLRNGSDLAMIGTKIIPKLGDFAMNAMNSLQKTIALLIGFGLSLITAQAADFSKTSLPYGYSTTLAHTQKGDTPRSLVKQYISLMIVANKDTTPEKDLGWGILFEHGLIDNFGVVQPKFLDLKNYDEFKNTIGSINPDLSQKLYDYLRNVQAHMISLSPQELNQVVQVVAADPLVKIKRGEFLPGQFLDINSVNNLINNFQELHEVHIIATNSFTVNGHKNELYFLDQHGGELLAHTSGHQIFMDMAGFTNDVTWAKAHFAATNEGFEHVTDMLNIRAYRGKTDSQIYFSKVRELGAHEATHTETIPLIRSGAVRIFPAPVSREQFMATDEVSGILGQIAGSDYPSIPFSDFYKVSIQFFFAGGEQYIIASREIMNRMLDKLHYKEFVRSNEENKAKQRHDNPTHLTADDLSADVFNVINKASIPQILIDLQHAGYINAKGEIIYCPLLQSLKEFKLPGNYTDKEKERIYGQMLEKYDEDLSLDWELLKDGEDFRYGKKAEETLADFFLSVSPEAVRQAAREVHKEIFGIYPVDPNLVKIPDNVRSYVLYHYFPDELKKSKDHAMKTGKNLSALLAAFMMVTTAYNVSAVKFFPVDQDEYGRKEQEMVLIEKGDTFTSLAKALSQGSIKILTAQQLQLVTDRIQRDNKSILEQGALEPGQKLNVAGALRLISSLDILNNSTLIGSSRINVAGVQPIDVHFIRPISHAEFGKNKSDDLVAFASPETGEIFMDVDRFIDQVNEFKQISRTPHSIWEGLYQGKSDEYVYEHYMQEMIYHEYVHAITNPLILSERFNISKYFNYANFTISFHDRRRAAEETSAYLAQASFSEEPMMVLGGLLGKVEGDSLGNDDYADTGLVIMRSLANDLGYKNYLLKIAKKQKGKDLTEEEKDIVEDNYKRNVYIIDDYRSTFAKFLYQIPKEELRISSARIFKKIFGMDVPSIGNFQIPTQVMENYQGTVNQVNGKLGSQGQIKTPFSTNSQSINHNKAMLNRGGIDLTFTNNVLHTRNNGGEIKFHVDAAMLARLQNAPGFVPVIINIQPLKSLSNFLGLNQELVDKAKLLAKA